VAPDLGEQLVSDLLASDRHGLGVGERRALGRREMAARREGRDLAQLVL